MSDQKYQIYLSNEDLQIIDKIGVSKDIAFGLRNALDSKHKSIYRSSTNLFLAEIFVELKDAKSTKEKMELMWSIINYNDKYNGQVPRLEDRP